MIKQTIIPKENFFTLTIPEEWIGERITIIYDKEWIENKDKTEIKKITKKPSDVFADCKVDLSNFIFNRDEANNYE